MRITTGLAAITASFGLVGAGCVFSRLDDDLALLRESTHLFAGEVSSEVLELHSTVVVSLADDSADSIVSFRILNGEGDFEFRQPRAPAHFFAFADLDKDLRFQPHEPFGWAASGHAVDPAEGATLGIDIVIGDDSSPGFPESLVDEPLELHLNNYARTHNGSVTPLSDPLLSRKQGRKGLWQPFAFWEDGGAGVHFLQPYEAAKTPVLFVHGISGSPQDFAAMIEKLDKRRFQPWVASYPSGMRLSWLARGVYQFVEVLHRQYGFDELHIVAHSMGGLVTRGALNWCAENRSCSYISSYTTLSTPWNGVAAAGAGVKWAPTVVPVWHDLYPDSDFVATLFDTALPDALPHYLVFGFNQGDNPGTGSSDGVIDLASQLRSAAQRQASLVRGFDEDHVSILRSDAVIESVFARF